MERPGITHDQGGDRGCRGLFREYSADRPVVSFPADEKIVAEGSPVEGVFCIHHGSVALLRVGSSLRRHCTGILGAGDFIGIPEIVTDAVHCCSAVALEPVTGWFIPAEQFLERMRQSPRIAHYAIGQLCRRLDHLERLLDDSPPA